MAPDVIVSALCSYQRWQKVFELLIDHKILEVNIKEFIIKSKAGLNSFKVSVKELVEKTNIMSLKAKTGRYGGTSELLKPRAAK